MALKRAVDQWVMKFWLGLMMAVLVSACASTGGTKNTPSPIAQQTQPKEPKVETPKEEPVAQPEPVKTVKDDPVVTRDGLTPPHMKGRDVKRLALLLPFSSRSDRLQSEASSMLKAAEMALFARDESDVVLIALDTKGTAQGARTATQAAIKSGADVILGPVLAKSVKAAGNEARKSKTPVIAFSTDQSVAGNGTYLLSFPPEAEVKRIVDYAASSGAQRFAYLGPQSAYGDRVRAAYRRNVGFVGGNVTADETYKGNDISVMQAPARKVSDYYERYETQTGGQGRRAFEAIMLPEGGTPLRSLAPLLPYYDIDPADVQFMGTGLWHREDTVREPALNRGIFAGPDRAPREAFKRNYDRHFAEDPSRLASLAYDAVMIGAYVADGKPSGRHARTQNNTGFYGADGLVKFNFDGTPDRGLAVYQIRNGRFIIIDPAPKETSGPS